MFSRIGSTTMSLRSLVQLMGRRLTLRKPHRTSFACYHDKQSTGPITELDKEERLPNSGDETKKISLDMSELDSCSVYDILCAAIVPRPIAFVSTCSVDGKVNNLAAFSFFMPVTSIPATLAFSITRKYNDSRKDTLVNILETGHFVVNHVSLPIFDKAYQASYEFESHQDEFDEVGFTAIPSTHGISPLVKESALSLECSLYNTMDIGEPKYGGSTLVVGKVLCLHVNESSWKDGHIIPETLQSVSRLGAMHYGNADIKFGIYNDEVWSTKHW